MKIIAQIPGSIVAFFVAVAGAETITFETRRSTEMMNGSLERRVDDNAYGNASTLQLTAAASRKTHGTQAGAGTFDVNLPLTGEPGVECRTTGLDGNHTLVFTFSNNIVSGSASVTDGTGSAGTPTFADKTMNVDLSGVADAQQITVTLSAVTDVFGQVLSGTAVSMNVLAGDTTGDTFVNSADISQTRSQSGAALDGTNFRVDVTVSGAIDSGDISFVKSASGTAVLEDGPIPTPVPTAPPSLPPATGRVWGPSNPVIYVNDETKDTYTDAYVMALASNGEIQLRGMITSTTTQPYNINVPAAGAERNVRDRQEIVNVARSSGLKNIPDPVTGPLTHLNKPLDGQITSTVPIGTAGSWLIVNEARNASVQNPLVVVMGGPVTAAVDAILLDPSIADKMIILWDGAALPRQNLSHLANYNAWADGWAAIIAFQKLRLVFCDFAESSWPYLPKSYLQTLPGNSALRTYLINQDFGWGGLPGNYDRDAAPAISVMRADYSTQFEKVAYTGLTTVDGHEVPTFEPNSEGRVLMTRLANGTVGTNEWRRAVQKALTPTN